MHTTKLPIGQANSGPFDLEPRSERLSSPGVQDKPSILDTGF